MKKQAILKEIPLLVMLLLPTIYLLVVWNQLPEQLPMHWNLEGEIDNYGPKYVMPLMALGLYLLLLIVPKIDPRRKNFQVFAGTYYKLRLIVLLFFSAIEVMIIYAALGNPIDQERYMLIGILLLLTILGNYMGTIKPNWLIGIRVPWTLDSATVWKKTHYLAGKIWFWTGLGLLILSFILPMTLMRPLMFACIGLMVIIPVFYAYSVYKKEQQIQSKS